MLGVLHELVEHVSWLIHTRRCVLGSRWRKLSCFNQGLLVLAHLRRNGGVNRSAQHPRWWRVWRRARMGRPGMPDAQKRELWDRWKAGESISVISRALGRPPGSIFTIVKANGGYVPPVRRRRPGSLTFTERESISRGLAPGDSLREISRAPGRAASTISREIARNKGARHYRAVDAEDRAWDRARRSKPCLLATNEPLRALVAEKLAEDWSPKQIAGHLAKSQPAKTGMRISHESIYKSLFMQTRKVLAKELQQLNRPVFGRGLSGRCRTARGGCRSNGSLVRVTQQPGQLLRSQPFRAGPGLQHGQQPPILGRERLHRHALPPAGHHRSGHRLLRHHRNRHRPDRLLRLSIRGQSLRQLHERDDPTLQQGLRLREFSQDPIRLHAKLLHPNPRGRLPRLQQPHNRRHPEPPRRDDITHHLCRRSTRTMPDQLKRGFHVRKDNGHSGCGCDLWFCGCEVVGVLVFERIISASPSAVFGVAVANPARTARAAFSASRVSDLPFMRRSRRSGRPASTTLWPDLRRNDVSVAP
ncbi:helix-turn-helix protein [Streptomyces sp. TLI_171]|nr:helix-turn-helix protein [Streptomyces sp. TLI_171]